MLPGLSVNTKAKLFDTMVLPILLSLLDTYGSEVWGAYLVTSHKSKEKMLHYIQDCQYIIDQLHSKFCKQTLCVHKRSCNYAVRLELGRLPLFINIICRVLKYYINVVNRNEKSPVKITLVLHKTMENLWYTFVKQVVEYT